MKKLIMCFAAVFLLNMGPAAHAAIVDTTTAWDGSSYYHRFGEGGTGTYGQTFTVPSIDSVLDSVTVYLNDYIDSDFVDFGFYVMAWDSANHRATGSILYQDGGYSTTNNGGADGFEEFTFNAGGLNLTPSLQYVFFLSASEYFDGVEGTSTMGGTWANNYSEGYFLFMNNESDFGLLTTNSWNVYPQYDLAFTAEFSAPANTPIPGAVWLLGSGILGMVGLRKMKK